MDTTTSNQELTMVEKKTLGKRKREKIERIENSQARMVAFSKRSRGLFRKVNELCSLSGSQIVVIVRTQAGRLYTNEPTTFDLDSVVEKFLQQSSAV